MTIPIEDVRIGNKLYYSIDHCTIEVLPEDIADDLAYMEPILLTDEMLDRLGLQIDEDSDERPIGTLFSLEVEDLNSYNLMIGGTIVKRKIKYVHNLQNICYELGEELIFD